MSVLEHLAARVQYNTLSVVSSTQHNHSFTTFSDEEVQASRFDVSSIIADGAVVAWEAAIMVAGYLLYIAIMVVNPRLLRWMDATFTCMAPKAGISIHPSGEKGSSQRSQQAIWASGGSAIFFGAQRRLQNPDAAQRV